MGQIINFLIVLGSLAGIVFILWRKIPLLGELPEESQSSGLMHSTTLKLVASRNLEKTFSKARQIASKTEAQTGEFLGRLRKKSKERKEEFSESYREQLSKKPEE